MANEKRLIDANELAEQVDNLCADWNENWIGNDNQSFILHSDVSDLISDAPTVDAVPTEQFNTLKSLVNGEWVGCKLVQEALDIDFATGLKLFDFSRTAEWNPDPLNGQRIITKFRLKNAVVHGRWIDNVDENGYLCNAWRKCSACGGLNYSKKPPYCPNCGAKMDGDGNA